MAQDGLVRNCERERVSLGKQKRALFRRSDFLINDQPLAPT